jgi:endonuclease/exonuclease/phosphatase family metal-dependent hydrolase
MNYIKILPAALLIILLNSCSNKGSENVLKEEASLSFEFENNLDFKDYYLEGSGYSFTKGIKGSAIKFDGENYGWLKLNGPNLTDCSKDFTIQFWFRSGSTEATTLLSSKDFPDKSISSQLNPGWALYTSGGNLAWTAGSGDRRLAYERDNNQNYPLCDNKWHMVSMSYSKELEEMRLYLDGHNFAIYKIGFDIFQENSLVIGTAGTSFDYSNDILAQIRDGRDTLQKMIDEFSEIGPGIPEDNEFLDIITDPDKLIQKKLKERGDNEMDEEVREKIKTFKSTRSQLMNNPYTVYQIMELTLLKPVSKIYSLVDGEVKTDPKIAKDFTMDTKLHPAGFSMDKLMIWDRVLNNNEILSCYGEYKKSGDFEYDTSVDKLRVGVWNIWHGGKHFTVEKDGWDSRDRIAEIIKEKDIDIILMQETYSSGDYIAAKLGYYFATTSDWDYCFQGSNISVLSRYPINKIHVPLEASFMNVGAHIQVSGSQKINAMSNWYGMNSFPIVFDFHSVRFEEADEIPVLFGGDFNAVPPSDGGDNPATAMLLNNGFKDAYRNMYPDIEEFPGYSHRSGRRIDQLYFKGKALNNTVIEVISDWPGGFPSDHFLIYSEFELK